MPSRGTSGPSRRSRARPRASGRARRSRPRGRARRRAGRRRARARTTSSCCGREKQRHRRRPLAQVGAGDLPGLLRLAGAVEDVVGDLERDPEREAVGAELRVAARAEQARGLEELPGLQRAPLEVGVDRRLRVVASGRAASPRRGRGRGRRRRASSTAAESLGRGELGERAREEVVAGRERRAPGRRPTRRRGRRGASARRRRGRRGRASPCGRARPPRPPRAAARSRAPSEERKQSSGRSRLPPAASASRGDVRREPLAAPDRLREPRLELGHVGGEARGRVDARAFITLASPSVQRDDRAASSRNRRRRSRRARAAPRAPRRPGTGAPTPAGTSRRRRPGSSAAEQRARSGRTRARRTAAARPRGCVISRIASRPPGRSTRRELAQRQLEVGDVADAEADRGGVEGSSSANGRASRSPSTHSKAGRLAPRALEHPRREVEPGHARARPRGGRRPRGRRCRRRRRARGRRAARPPAAASRRQRRSRPAVITRFIAS